MPILGLVIALALVAFFFIRSGSDAPSPSTNPADAKATISKANHDIFLGQIRQQLQFYKTEHGTYPPSLGTLSIEIPSGMPLDYNAETGEVSLASTKD